MALASLTTMMTATWTFTSAKEQRASKAGQSNETCSFVEMAMGRFSMLATSLESSLPAIEVAAHSFSTPITIEN